MPLADVETVSSTDSSTQEAMASVGTSLSELLLKSAADKESTGEEIFKANQFTTASRQTFILFHRTIPSTDGGGSWGSSNINTNQVMFY